MYLLIAFRQCSIKTPVENMVECYINKHYEGESYRVVVKDNSKVEFNQYSLNAKMSSFQVGEKTIYEGENNDFPHIYFRQ